MEEIVIRSLKHENAECHKQGYKNWVQWQLFIRGIKLRPDWEHPEGQLFAAVSKGRWYVKCPYKNCRVNMPIDEMEPLVFCTDCLNVENDHKPFRVVWQNIKDLKLLLGVRRDLKQRNYLPHLGETHKHLELENKKLVKGIYYPPVDGFRGSIDVKRFKDGIHNT